MGRLDKLKHARNSDTALFWIPAFAGMTSCPPFDCAQDRLRPGIQCSCSLGNPLRTLLRQQANYAQSSDKIGEGKTTASVLVCPGSECTGQEQARALSPPGKLS